MTTTKTTLLIVRHGQTEWNVERKMQGHQDSPLTELGIKQAQWLGESIEHTPIDVIYSSPSPRARRTAEIIRGLRDIPIIETDAFKEINMGVWEGRTQDEVRRDDPDQFYNFWSAPDDFRVPDGELFHEVSERTVKKIQEIIRINQGKTILIVTHSVIVKLLMAYFEGKPIKEIWTPPYIHPACLCKVELKDDNWEIILHGDISHYKEDIIKY